MTSSSCSRRRRRRDRAAVRRAGVDSRAVPPSAPSGTPSSLRRVVFAAAHVALPALAAVVTMWVHLRFLAADTVLPAGDAAGHLINVGRAVAWLRGGPLAAEAFPPGLYTVAALLTERLGPTADNAVGAVVLFAALQAAALAWLGLRASGVVASLLLPLLALAAPLLSASARDLLLDLPATACIVCVWVLAWESRCFKRAVPTMALGVALAAGALVKYTLFLWVVPLLLACGVGMLLRSPTALVPLLVTLPVLRYAGLVLASRAAMPSHARVDPAFVAAVLQGLALTSGLEVAILTVLRFAPGPRDAGWRRGLAEGAWLGLSSLLAVALIFPWFHHAMPAVWAKVRHEAIDEVRTSGLRDGSRYALAVLTTSWPGAWRAVQVGLGIEAAALVWTAGPWFRAWRAGGLVSPFTLGPALPIAATCVLASWWTVLNLPVDPRYFLPLVVGAAITIGLGAARFAVTRWTYGVAVAVACLLQIAAGEGIWTAPVVRVGLAGFNPSAVAGKGELRLVGPPAPRADPVGEAVAELVTVVGTLGISFPCDAVLLAVPGSIDGRPIGLESRVIPALGSLSGIRECAWIPWEGGERPTRAAGATYVAIAALREHAVGPALAGLSGVEPVFEGDAGGRVIRLVGVRR